MSEEQKVPMCHFTPMEFCAADDWPAGTAEWFECKHCGHTVDIGTTPRE